MAQCKYCNKKSFFLSINELGLCSNCNNSIAAVVEKKGKVIKKCLSILDKSKDIMVVKKKLMLLRESSKSLYEYERMGIQIIEPKPSELLKECGYALELR